MSRFTCLLLAAPLLIGCVSVTPAPLQMPVAPVAPMLSGAGDLEASLGFSADASPEARVAYSPLPNVVAFASGSHSTERSDDPGSFDRTYGEGGIGFYTSAADLTFEVLGGLNRSVQHGVGNWVEPSSGPRCAEDPICLLIPGPLAAFDSGMRSVPLLLPYRHQRRIRPTQHRMDQRQAPARRHTSPDAHQLRHHRHDAGRPPGPLVRRHARPGRVIPPPVVALAACRDSGRRQLHAGWRFRRPLQR